MPEETKHHMFGPSSLERRELCPASYRLEEGLPSFETEHAKDGTEKHAKAAAMIEAFKAGKPIEEEDEAVVRAFDKFREILPETDQPVDIFTERPLSYKYCGIEQYRGTSDVVIVTAEKIVIIDFKFGHRPVEDAANNIQGAAYALAAMKEFQRDVAEVHFCNPVIGQYSSHTFNDWTGIAQYILGVINRCKQEGAPAVPGEVQCRYCKAAYHGTCPALAKTAELAAVKAEELVSLPSLSELPAETLVELKRKCDLVAKLADRVDNRIRTICEAEGSCGPFKLKTVSGGREIPEITEAFKRLDKVFTAEEYLGFCTLSVSKLEKGFAAKKKQNGEFKTEKEAKIQFCTELSDLIRQKPDKRTLVEVK